MAYNHNNGPSYPVSKDDLTIVIPVKNEEGAIGPVIDELQQEGYMNILVVDGNSYLPTGHLSLDYKIASAIRSYYLASDNYRTQLLSISSINSTSLIVFDLNGLIYNSLYITPEAYSYSYNLSLTQCLAYNSGNIVIVAQDV